MKVLVINCGSSSIKYQLFETDADQVLAKGIVSRIGEEDSYVKHEAGSVKSQKKVPGLPYPRGFELIVQNLLDQIYVVDALVFTPGMGENSPLIRTMICNGLEFLGVELDGTKNNETLATEQLISSSKSTMKVLVIPTNEERMIALDTIALAFSD